MNTNNNSFEEQEEDRPDNAQVRKDWHNLKKIIFNRNYLIGFIAISVLIIDLIIIDHFSPYLIERSGQYFKSSVTDISGEDDDLLEDDSSGDEDETEEKACNVKGINLYGDLITYIPNNNYDDFGSPMEDETSSEQIYFAIKNAEKDDDIKAIIIEVDSGGGDPVAGEEINSAIKKSVKPVIAYIRSMGASAAYWAISGADKIYSVKTSSVGGIGVNYSYVDFSKSGEEDGATFNELSSAKFKNIMSPFKELTEEEKELIMDDLQKTHNLFVESVAENRGLELEKVKKIADGWAYNGPDSLGFGLIDDIGGLDEVKEYLKKEILNDEDVEICW